MAERPLNQQRLSVRSIWYEGHFLIGGGVLLILAAQFWPVLPAITAIALIGRGAVLILQSRPRTVRQDSLVLINLAVYGILVCLAIIAQSNAVARDSATQVSLGMLLDHSAAIVVIAGLICRTFQRFGQPIS